MKRLIIIGGLLLMIAVSIAVLVKNDDSVDLRSAAGNDTTMQVTHNHNNDDGNEESEPVVYYQGEVVSFENGGGYTFIEVKEETELTFWIAVERVDVNMGDIVRFRKELVAKNYTSKSLNKTFDELMFASDIQYQLSE